MSAYPQPPQNPYSAGGTYAPHRFGDPEDMPHSGLGIASLILGVLCGVGAFGLLVAAGVMESSTPGGMNEESPAAIVLGLALFAVMGLCLMGGLLGIFGVVQSQRKKVFAILGLAANGLVFFGLVGIILLGLAMG